MIKYLEIKSGKDVVEAYYKKGDDVTEYVDWLLDNNYKIQNKKLSIMPLHISVAINLMRNNTLGVLSSEEDMSPGDIIQSIKDKGYRFLISKRPIENKYQYVVFYHGDMTDDEIKETNGKKYHYVIVGDFVDSLKKCVRAMVENINEDFLKNAATSEVDVQILTNEGIIIDKKFIGDIIELKNYIQTIMREGFMINLDETQVFHSPSTIKTVEIKHINEKKRKK